MNSTIRSMSIAAVAALLAAGCGGKSDAPAGPSTPYLDPAVANDPGVYPPPETMAKLFPNLARSQEFTRELNRTWTRFMTGK